jgi:hypothetical protein
MAILTDSSINETLEPFMAIEEAILYPSVLKPYTATGAIEEEEGGEEDDDVAFKVYSELPLSSLRIYPRWSTKGFSNGFPATLYILEDLV